jgi:hypothetical protein
LTIIAVLSWIAGQSGSGDLAHQLLRIVPVLTSMSMVPFLAKAIAKGTIPREFALGRFVN